jgi:uncharacterized radical SAM superfamily Fe-S cluster-containing enzyme
MKEYYRTRSVCPVCLRDVPARVVRRESTAVLVKDCPDDGPTETTLCAHGDAWAELRRFYHSVHPPSEPPVETTLMICVTIRCNLDCDFCLMFAGERPFREPTLEEIGAWIRDLEHKRITVFGGEPTQRDDLPEILDLIRRSGNTPVIQTNGVRTADPAYCETLRDAGLGEVFMSFDGASEASAVTLRGAPVARLRERTLENFERLGVPVSLSASVARGVNDEEMGRTLEFAVAHKGIKGVFFRSSIPHGPRTPREHLLRTDELMERISRETHGRIDFDKTVRFLRLFHALQPVLGIQRCWSEFFYVVFRLPDGGYETLDEVLDLEALAPHLDRFSSMLRRGRRRRATAYLLAMLPTTLRWRRWRAFLGTAGDTVRVTRSRWFGVGENQRDLSSRTLLLNFDELCHLDNCDLDKVRGCPNLIRDEDGEVVPFCHANLRRQRRWLRALRSGGEAEAREARLG